MSRRNGLDNQDLHRRLMLQCLIFRETRRNLQRSDLWFWGNDGYARRRCIDSAYSAKAIAIRITAYNDEVRTATLVERTPNWAKAVATARGGQEWNEHRGSFWVCRGQRKAPCLVRRRALLRYMLRRFFFCVGERFLLLATESVNVY